jgi:hypothetical protein
MGTFSSSLEVGQIAEWRIRQFLGYQGIEGEEFEAKTLYRNAFCFLETWSVVEKRIKGWLWDIKPYWYLWAGKTIICGLHGKALERWRDMHLRVGDLGSLKCKCGRTFELPKIFCDGSLMWQMLQETPDRAYHSAAFPISYKKLPMQLINTEEAPQLKLL